MRYLAVLADHGALSGEIEFGVTSIAEARDVIERRGTWQRLPGTDGDVLLSESAYICLYPAPYKPGSEPSHTLSVGAKGGVLTVRQR